MFLPREPSQRKETIYYQFVTFKMGGVFCLAHISLRVLHAGGEISDHCRGRGGEITPQ
jgi:hypothetical protein